MNQRLKQVGRSVLFVGTGFVILYFVFQKFDEQYVASCLEAGNVVEDCSLLEKLWDDFLSVNPWWIAAACFAFLLSNMSRAWRWKQLLEPLGYNISLWNGFWTIMLGYFANLGFPRIGEVIRGGTLSRYEKIPLEKSMGTIVADRVIDVFSFGIMLLLALFFEFDKLWAQLRDGIWLRIKDSGQNIYLWVAVFLIIVLTLVIYRFRQRLYGLGLVIKLKNILIGFAEGLQSVRKVRNIPVFVFHSISIWFLYYMMTYLTFKAFAPTVDLTASAALLVFVFGSLGMIIPAPGGMGSYQGLVALAVSLFGVTMADAFSYANINFFSIQIFCNVLFGMMALLLLPLINRKTSIQRSDKNGLQ